jgi:hypothetical protein
MPRSPVDRERGATVLQLYPLAARLICVVSADIEITSCSVSAIYCVVSVTSVASFVMLLPLDKVIHLACRQETMET